MATSNFNETIVKNRVLRYTDDTEETFIEFDFVNSGTRGLKIKYDRGTGTPKEFQINEDGVRWSDGILTYNTELGRLAVVQTAFQSVELPPNATTLKLNNSLLCSNGATNSITIDASNNNIVITDGTTTNTIDKTGYTTRNSVQNSTHYLNFSDSSSTGTGAIQKTAGLSCNPSTNTITATTFVGDLSGNSTTSTRATNIAGGLGGSIPYQTAVNTTALLANGTAGQFLKSQGTTLPPIWDTPAGGGSNATTIDISNNNTNATFFPTFVSASGSTQTLRADTLSANALKYNPSQNLLFSSDTASSTTLSLRSNYSNTGSGTADLDLVSGSGSSNMSVNLSCNDAVGDYSVLSLKATNVNLFTGNPNGEAMNQTGIQLTGDADIYWADDTYSTNIFYISRVNSAGWSWGIASEVGQYPAPPSGIGVFGTTRMTLTTAGVLTTFTPPICATAPTTANQLGNKTYIDNFGGSGGWYYTTTISPSATTNLAFPNCLNSAYNAYEIYFVSNLSSPTTGYVTFQMSFSGITTPTYQSWTTSLSSTSGASPAYTNSYATTAPYLNFAMDFNSYINRAYTYPLELWGTKSITGGASSGRFQYLTEGQVSSNPGFTGFVKQMGSVGYASGNLTGLTLTANSAVTGSFTIIVKAKY